MSDVIHSEQPHSEANISENVHQRLKDIVRRQTDYTDDTIIKKLYEHNNNIINIIREYMNNEKKPKPKIMTAPKTTNQMLFAEIRKLMDDASEAYRKKQEVENIQ